MLSLATLSKQLPKLILIKIYTINAHLNNFMFMLTQNIKISIINIILSNMKRIKEKMRVVFFSNQTAWEVILDQILEEWSKQPDMVIDLEAIRWGSISVSNTFVSLLLITPLQNVFWIHGKMAFWDLVNYITNVFKAYSVLNSNT